MADRTSAGIFGKLFSALAEINDDTAKKIAAQAWEWSKSYDFMTYQMGVDDEVLAKLGIELPEED